MLGAYLLLLPQASVLTAFIFVLSSCARSRRTGSSASGSCSSSWEGGFSIAQPQSGGGTAFFAHVGGFVFGLATVRLFAERPPLRPAW